MQRQPGVMIAQDPSQYPRSGTGPGRNARRPGFAHDSSRRCGIVQIACGMAVIGAGITNILLGGSIAFLGTGIWTGLFFITAGALGIRGSETKKNCPIVGCLVISILASLAALAGTGLAGLGLGIDISRYQCFDSKSTNFNMMVFCSHQPPILYNKRMVLNVINILHGICVFFSLLEAIVALVHSVICCRATCCGKGNVQDPVVVYVPYTPDTPTQPQLQPQMEPQIQYGPPGYQPHPHDAYHHNPYAAPPPIAPPQAQGFHAPPMTNPVPSAPPPYVDYQYPYPQKL